MSSLQFVAWPSVMRKDWEEKNERWKHSSCRKLTSKPHQFIIHSIANLHLMLLSVHSVSTCVRVVFSSLLPSILSYLFFVYFFVLYFFFFLMTRCRCVVLSCTLKQKEGQREIERQWVWEKNHTAIHWCKQTHKFSILIIRNVVSRRNIVFRSFIFKRIFSYT